MISVIIFGRRRKPQRRRRWRGRHGEPCLYGHDMEQICPTKERRTSLASVRPHNCFLNIEYLVQGSQKKFVVILRAVCRRQFLEPEAERCGVGKLTMRRTHPRSVFFVFLDCGFILRKKHFGVLFGLMGKNNLRYSFWSRHRKKTRKYTSPYR